MARRLRGKRLVAVVLVSFIVVSSAVLDAMGVRVLLSPKDALDTLFGLFEASLQLIEEPMHCGAALGVSPWVLGRGVLGASETSRVTGEDKKETKTDEDELCLIPEMMSCAPLSSKTG